MVFGREAERLGAILRQVGGARALRVDELHGLVAAVVCGPDVIAPSEWIVHAVGSEELRFENAHEAREFMRLITGFYNSTAESICKGSFCPLLETECHEHVARGWCRGFLRGVFLRWELWLERMDADEELVSLLTPISAVLEGEMDRGEREGVVRQRLSCMVPALRSYWLGRKVVRLLDMHARDAAKPCPCGSGKRYRECCGAPS